jgi:hypothetical protein
MERAVGDLLYVLHERMEKQTVRIVNLGSQHSEDNRLPTPIAKQHRTRLYHAHRK